MSLGTGPAPSLPPGVLPGIFGIGAALFVGLLTDLALTSTILLVGIFAALVAGLNMVRM